MIVRSSGIPKSSSITAVVGETNEESQAKIANIEAEINFVKIDPIKDETNKSHLFRIKSKQF